MNPIKKIVSSLLIMFLLGIQMSCLDDEFKGCQEEECTSFDLTIALPKPTLKETRANSNRTDFTDLSSLHIIVYPIDTLNNEPLINYYNEKDFPDKKMLTAGEQITLTVNYNGTFGDINKIYLVGNYEKDSINPQKNQYPSSIRDIKVEIDETNFIPKCVYFGEAKKQSGNTTGPCGLYKAELKRPFAMITINMEDIGLNPNLKITPKKIGVHRFAKNIKIGSKKNKVNSSSNFFQEGYDFFVDWGSLDGQTKFIGQKYSEDNNVQSGQAFYVFENMQDSIINDDETKKDGVQRPNATYISLEADYIQFEEDNPNQINVSGKITYCFWLGKDEFINYEVERNWHYEVTLQLYGYGGAHEGGYLNGDEIILGDTPGATWRVSMDTDSLGFENYMHINLNARSSSDKVKLSRAKFYDINVTFNNNGGTEDWFFINNGSGWEIIDDDNIKIALDNKEIYYYVKPWRMEDIKGFPHEYRNRAPYRECIISGVKKIGDPKATRLTIRQWAPLRLPDLEGNSDPEGYLYMDRFEDNNSIFTWGYQNNNLSSTLISPIESYNKFDFGKAGDGLNNTAYLNCGDSISPIANYVISTTGYNEATGSSPLFGKNNTAMYYIPNSEELQRIMEYESIINNSDSNRHDPVNKNADYWSSSVLESDSLSTLYWDGVSKTIKSTKDRNSQKRVRYVYRPSKDLN